MRISIDIYFNLALLLPRASGFIVVPRLGLCVRHDHGHPEAHAQCTVHELTLHPRRMPQASLVVGLQPHLAPFRRRLITHGGLPRMATSEGSDQNESDRSQCGTSLCPSDSILKAVKNIFMAEGASKDKGIYGLDPEIIEREAAEAPFRRFRLVAYGTLAFAAILLGCVSIAGLSGVESVRELGQNLPNPILDVAVLGAAFYLWVEEVKTKRSTLRLMEKRVEQETRVPNRATRRQLKRNKSREAQTEKATVPRQRPNSAKSGETRDDDDVNSELKTPSTVSNSDSGMFGGMMKTLEAVNQQSYYQALALNKELEDKGVLPRLDRKPDPPEDEAVAAEDDLSRDSRGSLTTTEDFSAGGSRGEMDVTNEEGGDATTDAGQDKNRGGKRKTVGKNQKK